MTQKQVVRIVSEWQKRLGLTTWDVVICFEEPCSEDANATMTRSNLYERSELRLDSDWKKWTPKFTNLIVVHELMHLHTRDVEESFKPAGPSDDVSKQQNREIEKLVDRLAYRFVELVGVV